MNRPTSSISKSSDTLSARLAVQQHCLRLTFASRMIWKWNYRIAGPSASGRLFKASFLKASLSELLLLALCALLLAVTFFGPPLAQAAHYHDFADQRAWGGLPHAMDVLSNLPFLLGGLGGVAALWRAKLAPRIAPSQLGLLSLFFAGLTVTAGVSAYYHLQPADAGLIWDRSGMVLAFAGLLGLITLQKISTRAGLSLAAAVLLLGPLSVYVWASSGNLLPWCVLQLGGMVLMVCLARLPSLPEPALPVAWGWVIALYALAKLLELGDHVIFEWTGQWISGHSLKHLVASGVAWPVLTAVQAWKSSAQT